MLQFLQTMNCSIVMEASSELVDAWPDRDGGHNARAREAPAEHNTIG